MLALADACKDDHGVSRHESACSPSDTSLRVARNSARAAKSREKANLALLVRRGFLDRNPGSGAGVKIPVLRVIEPSEQIPLGFSLS